MHHRKDSLSADDSRNAEAIQAANKSYRIVSSWKLGRLVQIGMSAITRTEGCERSITESGVVEEVQRNGSERAESDTGSESFTGADTKLRGLGHEVQSHQESKESERSLDGEAPSNHRRVAQKGRTKDANQITTTKLRVMLADQLERCALSGLPLTPSNCQLDHIIPVSRSGQHRIDNVQLVNNVVNSMKGSMTNEEFIAMCERVADYAGRKCQGGSPKGVVDQHRRNVFGSP